MKIMDQSKRLKEPPADQFGNRRQDEEKKRPKEKCMHADFFDVSDRRLQAINYPLANVFINPKIQLYYILMNYQLSESNSS